MSGVRLPCLDPPPHHIKPSLAGAARHPDFGAGYRRLTGSIRCWYGVPGHMT